MSTFTPPVVFDRARVVARRHPGNALMRHYTPLPRGVNVYLLFDGTVTTTQPYDPQNTIVRRTFFGGHLEPVTDEEAALLTAAGYAAYIS